MAEESKNQEGREQQKILQELDRIAKLLVRRDLELMETRERREKELQELDRIAKLLIRRDLELAETREKREKEIQELRETRAALMNMLEDNETARASLEEERNKTLALIINFTDGLLFFDKENRAALMNPRAEVLLKTEAKDTIGKSLSDLSEVPGLKGLIKLLSGGVKISRKELSLKENLVLEVSAVPVIRKKEGLGVLVILHDITREKFIEQMKTEFVSIAAHQLRTPLSAVKWILTMILDREFGKVPEELVSFLEKAHRSNERMICLIDNLLDVARIEEGRYLHEPVFANIEDIFQLIINSYQEEIRERNLKLRFKKPEAGLPKIKVDVSKLKLAIQNLIENAIRYTPANGEVTISLKRVNMEIECAIKDTGVGIPKQEQKRIFTKFFRGSNVIRMETEGSGLGLFITKNIISAHNGKIWFESEEGKGTTFYFTLPIK